LREAGISPRKALGQHLLTDHSVVTRIVSASDLRAGDLVIEVGPGTGVLTEKLLATGARVFAPEIDPEMVRLLGDKFPDTETLKVTESNALAIDPAELLGETRSYSVVGNLPYNSGLAIVRHFLEAEQPPSKLVVMLQKEVADNVVAAPGELSQAGIGVQVFAEAKRLFNVPPRAFYPPPKVTSTVIRLDVRAEPLVLAEEQPRFFEIVRAGFSAPRKQIRNSLAQGLKITSSEVEGALGKAGISPSLRPQDLSIDDWLRLTRAIDT
jgi:16S rRNA (adenine1518-N6/adenine1519-N6)-dimethyltransferase